MAEKKWSELIKQYHTGKMADKEKRIKGVIMTTPRKGLFGLCIILDKMAYLTQPLKK